MPYAVLSRGTSAGLVGGAWNSDVVRCAQARVPLVARAYRTKPELAAALVAHLLGAGLVRADWMRADWMRADAVYGNSPALR